MSRIRMISFDVVNTILRVRGSPAQEYACAAGSVGIPLTTAQIEAAYRPTWREFRAKVPDYGLNQGLTTREWWHLFVCDVCKNAGYHGNPEGKLREMTDELWTRFSDGRNWEVLPGARDTLDRLRAHHGDVTLGVVSNFDERLRPTLERHDLMTYFRFLVTTAETRRSKPDPEMFRAAAEVSGISSGSCAHVGDNLREDYLASEAAGFTGFLLDSEGRLTDQEISDNQVDKSRVLTTLGDLLKFL